MLFDLGSFNSFLFHNPQLFLTPVYNTQLFLLPDLGQIDVFKSLGCILKLRSLEFLQPSIPLPSAVLALLPVFAFPSIFGLQTWMQVWTEAHSYKENSFW